VVQPHTQQVHATLAAPRLTRLDGQAHVLVHGEVGEELRQLKRAAQAPMRAPRRRQAGDVFTAQQHATFTRRQLTRDEVEVGRLARAIGAHDGGKRAGFEAARDMIDGHMAAEPDREVFCL
jgi:hypothetical protein